MPINRGNTAFTGTAGGICGYFRGGLNIIRATSSLTGARVKKDPAFEGFRKSCNRMREAAPIAAALYNLIPKEQKQFSRYRLLTGETLKMIKQGIDKAVINKKLQELYINPILQWPVRHQKSGTETRLADRSRSFGKSLFITKMSADPRITRLGKKRKLQPAAVTIGESSTYINTFLSVAAKWSDSIHNVAPGQQTISAPIYLGRVKEYRRLKMWMIPTS